ncbi:peptidoglycan-binding protein [Kitasatospora sp. NPDC053057]|uniref:peptidoglycan-binding protein n=1 Tax=Kitasatospora sp. NPDC053057 TaxID=3364062 RepID=UPI0037C9262B
MRNKLAAVVVATFLAIGSGVATAGSASAATSPSNLCGWWSTSEPELSYGDSGNEVKALQCELYNSLAYNGPAVDGQFGDQTLAAVKKFQTCEGLQVDGIVGPKTWAALDYQTTQGKYPVWCV